MQKPRQSYLRAAVLHSAALPRAITQTPRNANLSAALSCLHGFLAETGLRSGKVNAVCVITRAGSNPQPRKPG